MVDVAVVGGGIAGLAAAYELLRRGLSYIVLEQAPRAGGVVFSEQVDGFTVDGGPDSLLIQKPAAITLCREVGLGERLVPTRLPRVAYILRGGRLHALPAASVLGIPTRAGPFIRTSLFTWPGKLRMGAEIFVARRETDEDESIGSFITRRFGAEATTYLAEPLLAGIHAGDVDRLSMNALFPRLVAAERTHGSVIRAFRAQANADPGTPNAERRTAKPEGAFLSLPNGLSELIAALTGALGASRVRLNAAVTVIHGTGPFTVHTADGGVVQSRAVLMATPAYVTGALLRDRDAEIARLCAEIPYASAATIALAFRRGAVAHPLNGSGFVVPRVENAGILAASWLSSKWPNRAPGDQVLLRAFVGGARDPQAPQLEDAALVRRSLDALRPLAGISEAPLFTRVYRWLRGNAQHEVGHLARIDAIDRRLAAHSGVFITGSGFRGVGIPDCVADARATATQMAAWLEQR